jgi:hypothetical protein
MQAFPRDAALPQPHFVHSMGFVFIAAIPQIVDEKDPYTWEGEKRFPRPLFDQVRGNHRQCGEPITFTADVNRSQRDECLASAAFRDHHGRPRLLPAFGNTHDGDGLGGKRLSQQLLDSR